MFSNGRPIGKWILILAGLLVTAPAVYAQNSRVMVFHRNLVEPPDPARELFNVGQQFYDQFRYSDAERTFREFMVRYPRSSVADKAEYYLIRTLSQTGKTSEALNRINDFKKNYPKSTWNIEVEEMKMQLTNEVPPSVQAILVRQVFPPVRPVSAAPRIPNIAPPPTMAFGPIEADNLSAQISLLQEALRVTFHRDMSLALQISAERLRLNMADPVVISTMSVLATTASTQGLPILVNIAKNSPDLKARQDAIFFMSQTPNKDTIVDTLMSLLPSLNDEGSDAVTFALAQIGTEKAFKSLAGIVTDKTRTDKVRGQALSRLGQTHDPRTFTLLTNIATTDPDFKFSTEAVMWLNQIKNPEATQVQENLRKK